MCVGDEGGEWWPVTVGGEHASDLTSTSGAGAVSVGGGGGGSSSSSPGVFGGKGSSLTPTGDLGTLSVLMAVRGERSCGGTAWSRELGVRR